MAFSGSLTLLASCCLALLTCPSLCAETTSESTRTHWKSPSEAHALHQTNHILNLKPIRRRLSEASPSANAPLPAQNINLCKIYSATGTCLYCIRDHYLNTTTNTCVRLPYSNLIANCNIYASQTTCYQCDKNYAVNSLGTSCFTAIPLPNCAVQYNNQNCTTCVAGSFLNPTTFQCSAVIPNCAVALSTTACQTCQPGYYISSLIAACAPLTSNQTVANCAAYGSNGACERCALGYALDLSANVCRGQGQVSQKIDPNCANTVINTGQYCNFCRQGYYLKNGACIVIPGDSVESCMIADWNLPSRCLVCMPSYQLLSNDTCASSGLTVSGQNDPLSVGLLNAIVSLFLGVLLVN